VAYLRTAIPRTADRLALILAEFPDKTLIRIAHYRAATRTTPIEWITQGLYEPLPEDGTGGPTRYRNVDGKRLQYTGTRRALVPEHLRRLEAELAEEHAVTTHREPTPDTATTPGP
jgi:hypothetical protein